MAAKNLRSFADNSHLLWSAARSLSATRVAEAALALEMMAHRNQLNGIDSAYYALRQEAVRLVAGLTDFRQERCGLSVG